MYSLYYLYKPEERAHYFCHTIMSRGNSDATIQHSLWQRWPKHSIWTNLCCRLPSCANSVWNLVSVDGTMAALDYPSWSDAVEPVRLPADPSRNDRQFLFAKILMHTVQPAVSPKSNHSPDRQPTNHVHSIGSHLLPNDRWYVTIFYRKAPNESIDIYTRQRNRSIQNKRIFLVMRIGEWMWRHRRMRKNQLYFTW